MNAFITHLRCVLARARMNWRNRKILALTEKRERLARTIALTCQGRNQDEIAWKAAEAHLLALRIERSQALKIQQKKAQRTPRCAIRVISG